MNTFAFHFPSRSVKTRRKNYLMIEKIEDEFGMEKHGITVFLIVLRKSHKSETSCFIAFPVCINCLYMPLHAFVFNNVKNGGG